MGKGASLGKEAVLADSGRAGEIAAGVGQVTKATFSAACYYSRRLRWASGTDLRGAVVNRRGVQAGLERGGSPEVEHVMEQIKGVKDLGIFRLVWQPNLLIQVAHEARVLLLQEADVNAVAQAVFGGQAITQVYGGEPFFDLVVRFLQEF